jgi:hypothetical protein
MDEASLKQALQAISGKDLSLRKAWYSPVAEAYQATRPSYPSELVGRAVSAAKLSSSSGILELGCGPGTATVSFAALGCAMVCLEPKFSLLRDGKAELQGLSFGASDQPDL